MHMQMTEIRTPAQYSAFARELTKISRGGARIMQKRRLGAALALPTNKVALRHLLAEITSTASITKCPSDKP